MSLDLSICHFASAVAVEIENYYKLKVSESNDLRDNS